MSAGVGIPSLSLPGVRDTRKYFIGAERFAGVDGPAGWQPEKTFTTANNMMIRALVQLDDVWPKADLKFRVVWSTDSTTTTDGVTWRVRIAKAVVDTTALDGITLTALDTTITEDFAIGTANVPLKTAAGLKIGGILADPTDFLFVAVDCNAVTGLSLDEFTGARVTFLGLEIEYVRGNL